MLKLINVAACKACDDFTVFDSTVSDVMVATLMFKWNSVTGRLFYAQFFMYLFILFIMLFGFMIMSFAAHPKVIPPYVSGQHTILTSPLRGHCLYIVSKNHTSSALPSCTLAESRS